MTGVLVKRGNLDSQRNISCLQRKDRGEDTVRRPPSVRPEKGLLRNQPCGHLDLALPVSGTVRNKGLLLKSLRWWYLVSLTQAGDLASGSSSPLTGSCELREVISAPLPPRYGAPNGPTGTSPEAQDGVGSCVGGGLGDLPVWWFPNPGCFSGVCKYRRPI